LHDRVDALDRERAALEGERHELAARERSLEQAWERKYAAKLREVEKQAETLAADFERRARETVEDLSQKARARIAKTSREYQESVAEVARAAAPTMPAAQPKLKLEEGARVRLKGIRQPATVRRISGEMIEVDAGFLKMQVSRSDVEEILPAAGAPASKPSISFTQGPSFEVPYREINLIGQRAEQAVEQVDKLLDSAALAQVERIRIVHGHGMGILKRAIAEHLQTNPHVAKFYAARPEEGGTGATIVELK
jgi:DNA mismatch repair protein MutS2